MGSTGYRCRHCGGLLQYEAAERVRSDNQSSRVRPAQSSLLLRPPTFESGNGMRPRCGQEPIVVVSSMDDVKSVVSSNAGDRHGGLVVKASAS